MLRKAAEAMKVLTGEVSVSSFGPISCGPSWTDTLNYYKFQRRSTILFRNNDL